MDSGLTAQHMGLHPCCCLVATAAWLLLLLLPLPVQQLLLQLVPLLLQLVPLLLHVPELFLRSCPASALSGGFSPLPRRWRRATLEKDYTPQVQVSCKPLAAAGQACLSASTKAGFAVQLKALLRVTTSGSAQFRLAATGSARLLIRGVQVAAINPAGALP